MSSHDDFLKAKEYNKQRILKISKNKTKLALLDGPKTVINIIPCGSLDSKIQYEFNKILAHSLEFKPLGLLNNIIEVSRSVLAVGNRRNGRNECYTELCKKGIIEAIDTTLLEPVDGKLIPITFFEERITHSTGKYIEILKYLRVNTPIFVFITLIDADDYYIPRVNSNKRLQKEQMEYHFVMDNFDDEIEKKLEPYFSTFRK